MVTDVERVDAARFLAATPALVEVYRAAFCAPPWNEPEERALAFANRLVEDCAREGSVAVWVRSGAAVAGFAYGYTTTSPFPDSGVYRRLREGLGTGVDPLVGGFEVVELAVRPEHRGGGVGRSLLSAVVGDRPAWLVTSAKMPSAVGFYEHVGWRRWPAVGDLLVFSHRLRVPTAAENDAA